MQDEARYCKMRQDICKKKQNEARYRKKKQDEAIYCKMRQEIAR